ncbi:ATP-binding protein [Paenibacillus filicis]|uniref:histidine kinase n=1 Tax=Paenibacillus gyeongsangnamensis TaxID=3388067 RepID=A0ABT4QAW6_9BACL|nr:ATP-binding protein [Paenibacillus filicis]MCZ8514028.1 ATP-binding protein [Paenibacillus filicis]
MICIIGILGYYLLKNYKFVEMQYHLLLEHSREAIVIAKSGRWFYCNAAAVQLFGASSRDELSGCTWTDFFPTAPAYGPMHRFAGPAEKLKCEFTALDGESKHAEVTIIPLYIYNRVPYQHIIIRDITEQTRTEQALQFSEKLSSVGQMAAGIAHEIRNPLTSVKGFLQLFRARSQDRRELWDVVFEEINRIENIITELLMIARPKQSTLVPRSIGHILEQVLLFLSPQAMMNDIEIVNQGPEEELLINCDENQIKQVFINLIKNAFEAIPPGQAGRVRIHITRSGDYVAIQVADNGCGIPEEVIRKLGQPFFTTKEKGTGLGLTVSKEIILNHHGSLSITSETGKGTTFAICFPLHT